MAMPRLPTLKQILGERPRCQYCGKELKPVTYTVELAEHITKVPTADELLGKPQPSPTWPTTNVATERGYRPEFVFRVAHKVNWKHEPFTVLHFWTGKDQGYGLTRHTEAVLQERLWPPIRPRCLAGRLPNERTTMMPSEHATSDDVEATDAKPDHSDDQPYTTFSSVSVDELIANFRFREERTDESSDHGDVYKDWIFP